MKKPSKETFKNCAELSFKPLLILSILSVAVSIFKLSEEVEYTKQQLGSSGIIATQLAIGGDQIASEISKLKTTISYK